MNDSSLYLKNFQVTNIVANASLGFKINLAALSNCKTTNVIKNQKFPGVVYRGVKDVKSVLIFASGKLVFTGAKSLAVVEHAYLTMQDTLSLFRVDDKVDIQQLTPKSQTPSKKKDKGSKRSIKQ